MPRLLRRRRKLRSIYEIAPEDVFLDASNLPGRNDNQFEGRMERPVSRRSIAAVGIIFALIVCGYIGRAYSLEITQGSNYANISRNNRLDQSLIFATRGVIYDRTGKELAWNATQATSTIDNATSTPFAFRQYLDEPGLAHILGFVQYPKADSKGLWWRTSYTGISGVELSYDSQLQGINGSTIVESDAHGHVVRQNMVAPPQGGQDLKLSIDADVQSKLYSMLLAHAQSNGFQGGAAVIMDVQTGELIAITSFPEYDHAGFAAGDNAKVAAASVDAHTPLIDRAIAGLYAPGSIVKPIFASAALNENIISPDTQILSTGKVTIPNPYDPSNPSIFRDWAVHGLIDMRTALAVSSDEYFYTIGGGYGSQKGLGITKIDEYAARFGLGSTTGIMLPGEKAGVIPTPAWKAAVFGPKDPWRIGDTYHTAIGQYGFQVTPIQVVRYISAIANGGKLLTPQLRASSTPAFTMVGVPDSDLEVVREGMRLAVTSTRPDATVKMLNLAGIQIAAKTGTAQIGAHNEWMNSWSVGFWPASHPRYAYAVVLERAKAGTPSGAAPAMMPFFQWLVANHPEYTGGSNAASTTALR
jgi:penicillin-binding protein 2